MLWVHKLQASVSTAFLSSPLETFMSVSITCYKNTSGSLGEWEMLWEHELQASVSTAFLSSLLETFTNVSMTR